MNLELFLKLREMVSGGLAKVAETARRTTNAVKGSNDTLNQSYDTLKRKISEVEQAISKSTSVKQIREARVELDKLQRMAGKHPGQTGGSGGGGLLSMVRSYIGPLAIAGGIAGVFGAGAKQEQDIVGLRTFLGQEGAEKAYSNIRKDAAATPFDTDSLLMVNRSLISAGLSAQDARQDTLNLANAVSAVGGGNDVLTRMAANMQQIKTVGKATAMDIKQFAMTGINIYQLLADATGKNVDQVKEMDVSYDLLSDALSKAASAGGVYAGAMAAQSQTVFGRWSTLKDEIALGAADMGTALQPLMHALLDVGLAITSIVIPAVVSMVTWMKDNWNWLSLIVTVLTAAIAGYYAYTLAISGVAMATKIWAAVQWALNAAMSANPIGLVIAGIAALVAGIVWAWNKFEGFRMVVFGLWEMFKQVFTNIGAFFKKIFEPISEAIAAFKEGRYLDAAKAVGKMAFNMSPVGLAIEAVKFAKDGGFTDGLTDAAKRGIARGKNKPESSADDSVQAATPGGGALSNTPSLGKGGEGDETTRGIASSGPRIINVNINKMVEKIEVHAQNLTEGVNEIEARIEETLLRVLNSGAKVQ